jgi:hypothetical protein
MRPIRSVISVVTFLSSMYIRVPLSPSNRSLTGLLRKPKIGTQCLTNFIAQHLINSDTARKPKFQTHFPSLIFDRSTFASSIRFQNIYSRLNWSINRCKSRKYPIFRIHCPSLISIRSIYHSSRLFQIINSESWSSWKSRHLITSSGISHTTN